MIITGQIKQIVDINQYYRIWVSNNPGDGMIVSPNVFYRPTVKYLAIKGERKEL